VRWVAEALGETRFSAPEWDDGLHRFYNHDQIAAVTQALCLSLSRDDLVAEGQRRSILVVPVQGAADIASDPHLRERSFFQEVRYDHLGQTLEVPRPPFIGSAYQLQPGRAPTLGEHSRDVLTTLLGMDPAEIDRLEAQGVVAPPARGVSK
jgi:benzylsuccinate CoA-transferase BbsF subunit